MEVGYIGVPFRIGEYTYLANSPGDYPYTWFNVVFGEIHYGSTKIGAEDILLKTEEQFFQAINLVKLGITDIYTLQQLLGVQSCPPLTVSNLPLS